MKTALVAFTDFSPFSFTVTVETKHEAEMLRNIFSESSSLADTLSNSTDCGWSEANQLFEALGERAQEVLSR